MKSFLRKEQGSIAILSAGVLVGLIGAAAMAAELGNWYLTNVELQRAADMGAISGAFNYVALANSQSAVNAATASAQLNGAGGATAAIVGGIRKPSDKAVHVTATTTLPLLLTQVLMSGTGVTISAQSWAEIASSNNSGPACVLALGTFGQGVTNGLSIGGNTNLFLNGCTLRSNSDVNVFGAASVNTLGVYAAGSVTGSSKVTTTPASGQIFPNDGTIPDPYSGNAALQNAFQQLQNNPGGPSIDVKPNQAQTLSPGTYSSMDIKGTASLQPGTYIVQGSVTFNSQANIVGSGVTIIASGGVTVNGGASVSLTAPTANAAHGVPGVIFADPNNNTIKINGGASTSFSGALYFPKANISFSGNLANGGGGCTQVVAFTISFTGSSDFGSNCANLGTPNVSSGGNTVVLVQ